MNYFNNYASNNFSSPYMMQQPAAPRRQEQPIGQGFGFGANNFFGAGSSFLGNQFGQTSGSGYNQYGSGSNFTSPTSFFGGGQYGSQTGGIYNGGNTMNVYNTPAPRYEAPRYEMPKYSPPTQYHTPYVPAQPMPKPPVVPQKQYYPPTYTPPVYPPVHPPVYPPVYPPVHPPVYTDSKLSYGIVAGDPVTKILDPKTGKEISGVVDQAGGYHNYVIEDGKNANIAGGSFAPFLNGQADPNGFAAAQQATNANGFTVAGLAPRGLNITSLVGAINPAGNVANKQYNLQFGNGANVRIDGGTQVVTDASGKQFRLVAGGDPADDVYNSPDGLFKVATGVTLPGVNEARTVVTYNETPNVQNVFHAGFRLVNDGNLPTNRASAGTADGSYIPNFSYYDAQYTKAPGQV
ncbi:MAG: hypothetical protein H2174_00800 [Vampirovibrio sp.]|nr:hypothetical protein [Vampirovibrio sp.]